MHIIVYRQRGHMGTYFRLLHAQHPIIRRRSISGADHPMGVTDRDAPSTLFDQRSQQNCKGTDPCAQQRSRNDRFLLQLPFALQVDAVRGAHRLPDQSHGSEFQAELSRER